MTKIKVTISFHLIKPIPLAGQSLLTYLFYLFALYTAELNPQSKAGVSNLFHFTLAKQQIEKLTTGERGIVDVPPTERRRWARMTSERQKWQEPSKGLA